MPNMARLGSSSEFFLVCIDLWVVVGGIRRGGYLGPLPLFPGFALEDMLPIVINDNVKGCQYLPPAPSLSKLGIRPGLRATGQSLQRGAQSPRMLSVASACCNPGRSIREIATHILYSCGYLRLCLGCSHVQLWVAVMNMRMRGLREATGETICIESC